MTKAVPTAELAKEILYLLTETFESSIKDGNAYLDKGTGIFMTLNAVNAEDASKPAFPGATTLVAQTEHVRFYLVALEGFLNGTHVHVDWDESWTLKTVTPQAWDTLRADLHKTYTHTAELIEGFELWNEDELGDALAMLTHSAYHLGAIRQLVKALGSAS